MSDLFVPADRRRAEQGATWISELTIRGRTGNPCLVRDRSGRVYLVEGRTARLVPSGLIAHGLEQSLGATSNVNDNELREFERGVPVEVFEDEEGHAFLVIDGERCHLKGLPLAHRVEDRQAAKLGRGSTIDIAAANVSSRRLTEALTWEFQLDRVRAAVRARGLLGSARAVVGRARRSLRNRSGR